MGRSEVRRGSRLYRASARPCQGSIWATMVNTATLPAQHAHITVVWPLIGLVIPQQGVSFCLAITFRGYRLRKRDNQEVTRSFQKGNRKGIHAINGWTYRNDTVEMGVYGMYQNEYIGASHRRSSISSSWSRLGKASSCCSGAVVMSGRGQQAGDEP